MKLIYLMVDGHGRMESAKVGQRLIEMPDGYHPLTNDSVWQDSKRVGPPLLMITQGVLGPYGSTMTKEDVLSMLLEVELAERSFKPASVSKMWHRSLQRLWDFAVAYGIWLFMILVAAWAIIPTFMAGG